MKKVLFVLHSADYYSGATRSITDIIVNLHSKGKIETTVLLPEKSGTAIELMRKNGIKTIYLPYNSLMQDEKSPLLKRVIKLPFYIERYFAQKWIAKKQLNLFDDVDVVYSNTSTVLFGSFLATNLKIPHIWHFREFRHEDHRIHLFLGEKWHMNYAANHADRFIMISKSMVEKHEHSLPKEKIKLIYNELPQNYIIERESFNFSRPLQLLIAGDVKPGKGQLEVVKSIAQLKKKGIEVFLSIAGKHEDIEYKKKIDFEISENDIDKNVKFCGIVKDMNALRANMDVGIVASSREAFGRVTVEGMLANMCMVGCNSGGTSELIENGKTGLLFEPGNICDLVNCLVTLHYDRKLMQLLSMTGFEYAKKTFTTGKCSEEVYKTIFETSRLDRENITN